MPGRGPLARCPGRFVIEAGTLARTKDGLLAFGQAKKLPPVKGYMPLLVTCQLSSAQYSSPRMLAWKRAALTSTPLERNGSRPANTHSSNSID